MYMFVGAWLMAIVLWQLYEYYYFSSCMAVGGLAPGHPIEILIVLTERILVHVNVLHIHGRST